MTDASPTPQPRPDDVQTPAQGSQSAVTDAGELIRIGSMLRALIDEVREVSLDEPGRERLRSIHDRAIGAIKEVVSPDLADELDELTLPLGADTPSGPELRIAQAQLAGWLDGVFRGIQAAMFSQSVRQQAQGQPAQETSESPMPGRYL
ncbi:MAG: proteasome activator [Acidimicrobiia bacterium]